METNQAGQLERCSGTICDVGCLLESNGRWACYYALRWFDVEDHLRQLDDDLRRPQRFES